MESVQVNEQEGILSGKEGFVVKAIKITFFVYFFFLTSESIQLGHLAFIEAVPPQISWGLLAYLYFIGVLRLKLEYLKSKNEFIDMLYLMLCFAPIVVSGFFLIHSIQFVCWILAIHIMAYIEDLGSLRTSLNRKKLRAIFEKKGIAKTIDRVPSWYSFKAMRPFILFILLFWVFPTVLVGVIDLGGVSFFDPSEIESLQYTQQMTSSLFNLTVAFDGKLDENYPFGLNFYARRKFSEKDDQQKMIEKYGETVEAIQAAQALPAAPPNEDQVAVEAETIKPYRTFLLTTVDDLTNLIQARTASEMRFASLLALCGLFSIFFLADLPRGVFIFLGGGKILSAEDEQLLAAYKAHNRKEKRPKVSVEPQEMNEAVRPIESNEGHFHWFN